MAHVRIVTIALILMARAAAISRMYAEQTAIIARRFVQSHGRERLRIAAMMVYPCILINVHLIRMVYRQPQKVGTYEKTFTVTTNLMKTKVVRFGRRGPISKRICLRCGPAEENGIMNIPRMNIPLVRNTHLLLREIDIAWIVG